MQKFGPAVGIVAVLVLLGAFLVATKIAPGIGYLAIAAGVGIGIIYGLMGAAGIARRNHWL